MVVSSPYFFGVSTKKISRKASKQIERICVEEDCDFTEINVKEGTTPGVNGGRYQSWMACQNRGHPFDSETAQRVLGRIAKEVA